VQPSRSKVWREKRRFMTTSVVIVYFLEGNFVLLFYFIITIINHQQVGRSWIPCEADLLKIHRVSNSVSIRHSPHNIPHTHKKTLLVETVYTTKNSIQLRSVLIGVSEKKKELFFSS
jgi:hypothetical protein